MEATTAGIHVHPLNLKTGLVTPGLEPFGGEFQPPFATAYPGRDAHLIFVLNFCRFFRGACKIV
jgi:hypothetical protein